jgi:hypothetical protein
VASYLGYLGSFATIGAVWFAHTVITEYLDHADSVLIRLNLLLLLVVSFLPSRSIVSVVKASPRRRRVESPVSRARPADGDAARASRSSASLGSAGGSHVHCLHRGSLAHHPNRAVRLRW